MLRRIGLVGDVHAEDEYLAAALAHLAKAQVDRVLCVGDIVDGRGDVDRCVELLALHRVDTVRGNHDRWMLTDPGKVQELLGLVAATRSWLAGLPPTRSYGTVAGQMLLCHGLGEDDMVFVGEALREAEKSDAGEMVRQLLRLVPENVRLVLAGHTHQRGIQAIGPVTLVDAGTLRSDDNPCFSVVDLAERVVQFYDVDEDGSISEGEVERWR